MKRFFITSLVLLSIATVQAQAFSWDNALNFLNRVSENQAAQAKTEKTLADVEAQMAVIDKSVQENFLKIVSELSSWRESRNIKSQVKSNSSAIEQIMSNYVSNLCSNKDKTTKTISKLSSKEKTTLVNSLAALAQNGQDYLILATDGIKAASNAMKTAQKINEMATTLTNINRLAHELRTKASNVISLTNQMKTLASNAGLAVK